MPIARPATRLRQAYILSRQRNVSSFRPPPGVLPRQPQPTVSSDDGHQTLRLRQHGNRSLPLPPLLDPIRVAAKERHTARKLEVDDEGQTDFQKELAANPFAQALATPIRQCHLTRARLPTHFLQPFSASITSTPLPSAHVKPNPPITITLLPRSRRDLPRGSQALPSSTYVLNTRDTMQHLSKKRNWGHIANQRMQDQYARMIGKKSAKNVDVGREWVWDKDMVDVVLGQLRKEVVAQLDGLMRAEEVDWLAPTRLEAPMQQREGVATILMMRASASTTVKGGEDSVPKHPPVYPLQEMLGPEDFETISESLQSGGHGAWAILKTQDRRATQLQLALHRLAMYVGLDQVADSNKRKS